jgi:hypothetical protein
LERIDARGIGCDSHAMLWSARVNRGYSISAPMGPNNLPRSRLTELKWEVMEVPQMAFNDNAEHVRILTSVHKEIEGLRRRMQELQPDLSTSTNEVVNVARQELCASLVRRLVIAEQEVRELQDMLELNQKA